MSHVFAIHDLYARTLEPLSTDRGETWPLLRFEDHLLRRFGLSELLRIVPERSSDLRVRPVADEIWILIEGAAEFVWHDIRPGSPTEHRKDRLTCVEPTLVLAPFGVAFGCRAVGGQASLLRLATHAETETEDIRSLPWEEG